MSPHLGHGTAPPHSPQQIIVYMRTYSAIWTGVGLQII